MRSVTHSDWLARASNWLIAKPASILTLIVVGIVVRWAIHRAIDKVTRRAAEGSVPGILTRNRMSQLFLEHHAAAAERRQQRATAMGGLLRSVTTIVVTTIVLFMVVAQLGYDIAPLIASAGIIGVALGFGAQSLVKDFLSGIFLIMEDQYGVGDVVKLLAATGVVEAVGLRVTRLRDAQGVVWYVRNGEILAVGNMSQEAAVVSIDLTLDADRDQVSAAVEEVIDDMRIDPEFRELVLGAPTIRRPSRDHSGEHSPDHGADHADDDGADHERDVTVPAAGSTTTAEAESAPSAITMTIGITTTLADQNKVAQGFLTRLKDRLSALGIDLPDNAIVWSTQLLPH